MFARLFRSNPKPETPCPTCGSIMFGRIIQKEPLVMCSCGTHWNPDSGKIIKYGMIMHKKETNSIIRKTPTPDLRPVVCGSPHVIVRHSTDQCDFRVSYLD